MVDMKIQLFFMYIQIKIKILINLFNWINMISKDKDFVFSFSNKSYLNRFHDRCGRVISGHPGLFFFELILKEVDKPEIFGARSVPQRKVNGIFDEIIFYEKRYLFFSYGFKNLMKRFRC